MSGTNTANPYVKVYLLPDPYKSTKRKTKVAKRTLHPTYNETVSQYNNIHSYHFESNTHYISYVHGKILAGKKLVNLELFYKNFLTDTPKLYLAYALTVV